MSEKVDYSSVLVGLLGDPNFPSSADVLSGSTLGVPVGELVKEEPTEMSCKVDVAEIKPEQIQEAFFEDSLGISEPEVVPQLPTLPEVPTLDVVESLPPELPIVESLTGKTSIEDTRSKEFRALLAEQQRTNSLLEELVRLKKRKYLSLGISLD